MYMYIYVHIYSYTDTWTYIHANRFVRRIAALLAEGWFVEGGGGRGGGADGKHSAPGEAAVGLSLPGDGAAAALPAKTRRHVYLLMPTTALPAKSRRPR